jgi:hypothetical protein
VLIISSETEKRRLHDTRSGLTDHCEHYFINIEKLEIIRPGGVFVLVDCIYSRAGKYVPVARPHISYIPSSGPWADKALIFTKELHTPYSKDL